MNKTNRNDLTERVRRRVLVIPVLLVAMGCLFLSDRAGYARSLSPVFGEVLPVNDATLDRMRGGFSLLGMNYSIGITSATYMNGALVGTQAFYSTLKTQIVKATSGNATLQSTNSGLVTLTQVGTGNSSNLNLSSPPKALLTEIQNTMNNVLIQHYTGLNLAITHAANNINQMTTQSRVSSIGFLH